MSHAHKSHRDGGVDLGDDETRVVHGGVGAARGGAEVQAVLGDGDALDDRNINALKGLLVEIHREVRNVNVAEGYAAVIDRGAQILVGLVAEALFHASRADACRDQNRDKCNDRSNDDSLPRNTEPHGNVHGQGRKIYLRSGERYADTADTHQNAQWMPTMLTASASNSTILRSCFLVAPTEDSEAELPCPLSKQKWRMRYR